MAYIGPSLPGVAQPEPAPAPAPTGMSPADLAALAKKLAQQVINPELAAARSILTAADTRATNTEAAYRALADMRSRAAGETQQAYQTAAGSTAAFSKGYSDAMQAKVNGSAQSIDEFLGKLAAPSGQLVGKSSVGDVVYGLTGDIPASSLAAQGAAAGAYAAQQPGNAVAAGLARAASERAQGQASYADAVRKINAAAPGIVSSQLASLRKQEATEKAAAARAAADAKKQEFYEWKTTMGLKIDAAKQDAVGRKAALDERIQIWKTSGIDPVTGSKSRSAIDAEQRQITDLKRIAAQNERTVAQIKAANARTQANIESAWERQTRSILAGQEKAGMSRGWDIAKSEVDAFKEMGVVASIRQNKDGSYSVVPKRMKDGSLVLTRQARKDEAARLSKLDTVAESKARGAALTIAERLFRGVNIKGGVEVLDKNGDPVDPAEPVDFNTAVLKLMQAGIPSKYIVESLEQFYPVGEQGRPAAPGADRAVAEAAGSFGTAGGLIPKAVR